MKIIDGKQKNMTKMSEIIITIMGWIYVLGQLMQLITTILLWLFGMFYLKETVFSDSKTLFTFFFTIIIALIWVIMSMLWGRYNYKKYAHLKRRTFPKDTTVNDIGNLLNLDVEIIKDMQNTKNIVLEETIV